MYISIKWRGLEHSFYPVTGEYFQVSSRWISPAVRRAVKKFLERKFPNVEIRDEDMTIKEVARTSPRLGEIG